MEKGKPIIREIQFWGCVSIAAIQLTHGRMFATWLWLLIAAVVLYLKIKRS